eukprot:110237_1
MTEFSPLSRTVIDSINELTVFIESTLKLRKSSKKKQKKVYQKNKKKCSGGSNYSPIDIKIINMHLSIVKQNKYSHENNQEKSVSNNHKYSKLIDRNKKTDLYLEWKNDFCLDEQTEDNLLEWIMKQFPFEKYGFEDKKATFKLFLDNNTIQIKSASTKRSLIEYDRDLVLKTMNKFYNFRLRQWLLLQNKTLNMFFRNEIEKQWWSKQLSDLNNINANEWLTKCVKYKIMPSRLLKDYIAAKKIFIDDWNLSNNIDTYQQQFLDYYDDQSDLDDTHYYKPLNEPYERKHLEKDPVKVQLKANRNRGYKSIKTFLSEISKIPFSNGGFDNFMKSNDNILKIKQYKVYDKWIRFVKNIHRRKWMKYLKKRIENDINGKQIGELKEYEQTNECGNEYGIPNMDKLLNVSICEEMCKIVLMDGILGIQNEFTSHTRAEMFERFVFNAIRSVFGDRNDGKMMNEWDVRLSECCEVTPDVLFTSSVNVNGVDIYWMDMKHYYVTSKEVITFKKIGQQIKNYIEKFGNGAIVCCGFQTNFMEKVKMRYPEIIGTVLMLDASQWYPFAKRQR